MAPPAMLTGITGSQDVLMMYERFGHRIGSAEIESALVSAPFCSEAAVVGYPHAIKGEGILLMLYLKDGYEPMKSLL